MSNWPPTLPPARPPSRPGPIVHPDRLDPKPRAWERLICDYIACEVSETAVVSRILKLDNQLVLMGAPPLPGDILIAIGRYKSGGAGRIGVLQACVQSLQPRRRASLVYPEYRAAARSTYARRLRTPELNR